MGKNPLLFEVLLLVVALQNSLLVCCHGEQTHYITPDYQTQPCDGEPCFTLNDYLVQSATEQFASNTTVVFLPGLHYLDASEHVVVRDAENLSLLGGENPFHTMSDEATSEIICTNTSGFVFVHVTQLKVANLTLSYCGKGLSPELVFEALFVQTWSFYSFSPLEPIAVVVINAFFLNMSGVVVQNSTGYGLIGLNVLGDVYIDNSAFIFNNFHTVYSDACQNVSSIEQAYMCGGGNAIFAFADTATCPEDPVVFTFDISHSYFAHGVNLVGALSSGLSMYLGQTSYGLRVNLDTVTAIGNSATHGANVGILVFDVVDNTSITIQNSYILYANPSFVPTYNIFAAEDVLFGGGLFYSYGEAIPTEFVPICQTTDSKHETDILRISNSQFFGNRGSIGSGAYISFLAVEATSRPTLFVMIENCSFADNLGSPASALFIGQVQPIEVALLAKFVVKGCAFVNNSYPFFGIPSSVQQFEVDLLTVVEVLSAQDITFINCDFVNNLGSAIYAYDSKLRFQGDILFERNRGLNGGGLALYGDSLMLLTPETHVNFTENVALLRGGGVFVESSNFLARSLCFFQLDGSDLIEALGIPVRVQFIPDQVIDLSEKLDIKVTFESNAASQAGAALYGGNIDSCIVIATVHLGIYRESGFLFNQLFHFQENAEPQDTSLISSDPSRICLCLDGIALCDYHLHEVTIFPGQTFEVSAVAFGQKNGTSPGIIFSTFVTPSDSEDILLSSQQTQEAGKTCTTLSYTVSSMESSLLMLLAAEDSIIQEHATFISITLLDCPPGFELSTSSPLIMCDCSSKIQDYDITCDVETQTVRREAPLWISKDDDDKDSHGVVVHEFCPFDYCRSKDLNLNLNDPDAQCNEGRTGVLCGACRKDLSALLGDSDCKQCSDDFLSLLIPFGLAGLALVLLLFACDCLTVAHGTLNGLIFFANIVQVNRDIFFPQGDSNILTVFIAWINLDLGIQTCFYNGMTTYAKTWLQFIFPIYIWAIVATIILLSHYSSTIANLTGRHAVPVLATLFLLSFAKILRTVITALSFTFIYHSDDSITTVWLFDGNVEYFEGKHIPLFLASVAVILFITLPFIFILLFAPYLQAFSSHRILLWVNKIKPFLDAYGGPYKDKYRYWTGFLLFVRATLFLIFSFNVLQGPGVILLVITISTHLLSIFAMLSGGIYRKWPLSTLEVSLFLNLGILAAGTFYIHESGGSQAALVYTSVSVVFVTFIAIMACGVYFRLEDHYHLNIILKFKENVQKFEGKVRRWRNRALSTVTAEVSSSHNSRAMQSELYYTDCPNRSGSFAVALREPVLDSPI